MLRLLRTTILPVLAATAWISVSEFARNEFLLKSLWTSHYEGIGLTFPAAPVNGAIWGMWSMLFAVLIFILLRRFELMHAALIAWLAGFVMMWVVIGNLQVLPYGILAYAVPLSLVETYVAAWMIRKLSSISTRRT
jgi:hypothetical protein